MSDHYDDQNNKPTSESEDTSNEKGLSNLWQRFTHFGIAGSVLRIGTHTITILLVIAFIFALRNFYLDNVEEKKEADFQATVMAIAIPTMDAAAGLSVEEAEMGVIFPPYNGSASIANSAISRLAEPLTIIPSRPRVKITDHEVDLGQSVFSIAELYGLRPETILWGNYATLKDNPRTISVGQVLNILPVNGTLHQYNAGETLTAIANFFNTDVEKIIDFPGNELDPYETDVDNPGIADGTVLIIPDGQREIQDWGPPAITRENPASAAYYGDGSCGLVYEGAIGAGIFIWPSASSWLSGFDYNANIHPAIDIGGNTGDAIFATDSGVVVYSGWSNYGYGNLIVIDHGNGWQSAYAHLSGVSVGCGQSVYQGDVIGGMGSTGNSTGTHLHFELGSSLYGKVNPWDFLISP
ncbi:MAG: M23 family metallopeptidase [Chloroflexi bacterium]|mgnify:CR=1 FL=1|jgi:murein DD-endopeptidase MepM/ murein hydrolase activator NlpD|nr:M23 family metallopeptidase [Chloroflexota bacterium]MBT3669849.1 M23 family metallopeptidase [Chloroflexota bacterium]MBT4002861.1 M23 family metallopeptidase [Chloroflexota bacterium]MBT4304750.1 M23 family metallopeptidase [Chloroflexota bacterium]MBT4534748.1 M23 family metallopeptidase [Chloroflexota bacterium]